MHMTSSKTLKDHVEAKHARFFEYLSMLAGMGFQPPLIYRAPSGKRSNALGFVAGLSNHGNWLVTIGRSP